MSTTALAGLLDRAAARDAGAFAAFYDGTIGEAYLLARLSATASGGCEREVERIVREAYCAAWQHCGSFRSAGVSPTAWLMTLVRRAADADAGAPASAAVGTGRDERSLHDHAAGVPAGTARPGRPWARTGDGRLDRHRPRARPLLRG
jgi:hypothetical protein